MNDMNTSRFPIAHHGAFAWLTVLFARSASIVVDDEVVVTYGPWFRSRFPRSAIASVARFDRRVLSRGVHGWNGRWLVNGAGSPLVAITLDPVQRGRVMWVPVRLRELIVNVDDPDALESSLSERRAR
jgi:hypothetical protein